MRLRNYIRHPTSIPIVVTSSQEQNLTARAQNLSQGGLCFVTQTHVPIGAKVGFEIHAVIPSYQGEGIVVWRQKQGPDTFEVGMRFVNDDDYFRARMVEQVCSIEDYRQQQLAKGHELDAETAAHEWITQFAQHFDTP